MERSVLQGAAAFRWGAWLWMATVLLVSHDDLKRPWLAVALVGLALGITALDTVLLRAEPAALLRPGPVLSELAVGGALVLCDGWAYGPGHAFSTSQSLGSVWPLAGVLGAGAAFGPLPGAVAGIVIGTARIGAVLVNGADIDTGGRVMSLTSTVVFYALGGAAAGYLTRLLRRAERQISAARAREEVARTLHDGVLQTLAVVERRANDPALARLARRQERELREYLFGDGQAADHADVRPRRGSHATGAEIAAALRAAAARYEESFDGRVQVVVADDVPPVPREALAALVGATSEALTNAGKHGHAGRIQVYVEPDEGEGIFCSVKDDGSGFDTATTVEGVGLTRSVRGRVAEVGGRVEVNSRPGAGVEVCVWLR